MQFLVLLSLGFASVEAICHHGTALYRREAAEKPKFGYKGMDSPLAWHTLAAENTLCAMGKRQSPISVTEVNSKPAEGSSIQFDVTNLPDGSELENLGTTVEVPANGSIALNNKTYSLAQFHFHTPSEHRIADEYYPMEAHFVFQAADETLAVVGVMVEISGMEKPAAFLNSVFMNIDKVKETGAVAETAALDFTALKEHVAASTIWQYEGSLTTPSCDEGVSWNVVENPVFVDATTFRKVKSVVKFNARFTQNEPGEINLLDNASQTLSSPAVGAQVGVHA